MSYPKWRCVHCYALNLNHADITHCADCGREKLATETVQTAPMPRCNAMTCPALPIRVKHTCGLDNPLPIDKKANAMHLRDVAMNGIGEWIGQDLEAFYSKLPLDKEIHKTDCFFVEFKVNGKTYQMMIQEVF